MSEVPGAGPSINLLPIFGWMKAPLEFRPRGRGPQSAESRHGKCTRVANVHQAQSLPG